MDDDKQDSDASVASPDKAPTHRADVPEGVKEQFEKPGRDNKSKEAINFERYKLRLGWFGRVIGAEQGAKMNLAALLCVLLILIMVYLIYLGMADQVGIITPLIGVIVGYFFGGKVSDKDL